MLVALVVKVNLPTYYDKRVFKSYSGIGVVLKDSNAKLGIKSGGE